MSRCFPFPPPGYEKKPTLDEPDLLKKEKRKEKKHKKDKKDKEKRDGKEKREKDRSEGKHKEKKDKKDKDKHRDKKEKKSKSSNPDEKRVHGQFEGYNGEKVHPNDSTRSSSSSDKKQSLQFQNGEYHHDPIQRKEESSKEKNSSSDDKRSSIQFCGQNGEMVRNRIKATDTSENIKFVQELDRRIKNEEKGTGSHQFVVEGRKNSFNKIEIQKMDGRQSIMEEAGFGGRNATVQNKINGKTLPPFDNKIEKRTEQKEKMAEKDSDDKRGDKRKNKDRDKQRQGKDKDTEKEKKEEKAKEKSEQKRAEREKNKYIRKSESVANPNSFSAHTPENSFHGIGSEGNLKKRKDMETNGVSHENESRPNKMGRFSSNIAPENGRKLDSVQNSGSSLLDRQQGASQGASTNSFKMGSKGQRVNGMIDPPPVSASSKTPPFPAFNHIPAKPSPIKSPPVITNHVAAHQPPPAPTIKPHPPPVPNHIAAQPPPLVKPQPAVPNHIAAQPPPIKPQPAVPNHIAAQLPTPKPPPSIPNHIAARSPPLLSTPSTTAKQQPLSRPKPPPAVVNKAAPPPPLPLLKKKPPHPDTKYLNQILSVPKLDEWCGLDDQEWLFNRKEEYPCSSKKTTTMEVEENQVQVWSEAKHIESVDICALPYVIPY